MAGVPTSIQYAGDAGAQHQHICRDEVVVKQLEVLQLPIDMWNARVHLDEEVTVGDFVDWCKEGLERAGIAGEVLIVDSSRDRTGEIALARGARVLKTPGLKTKSS